MSQFETKVKEGKKMTAEVTTWKMSEEERLAYLEKHPVKRVNSFKKRDFKWRSEKGAKSRWNKDKEPNING